MKFHDFRIVSEENSTVKRVYIDGVEQKGVVACDIRLRPDEVPTIRLEYTFFNMDAVLPAAAVDAVKTFTDGVLNTPIEKLGLSGRAYNKLKMGLWNTYMDRDFNTTLGDVLIAYRTGHLRMYQGMGAKTYQEVIDKLKHYGLITEDE